MIECTYNQVVKVSVAMATYNGEKYIIELLESILMQTKKPDEVIICDDRSNDNTVSFICDFIKKNKLDNWRVEVNSKNLGWKLNFRKAINKTTGTIVFFADQDDIWFSDKIEKMTHLMIQYNMGCLYGHCQIIDSEGKLIKKRNRNEVASGKIKQILFKQDFYNIGYIGCCMCVSRDIIDKYLILNLMEDDHDSQCPRIALLYRNLWELDEPVIYYRIHSNNTSKVSSEFPYGSSTLELRIEKIEIVLCWLERIVKDSSISYSKLQVVKKDIEFLKLRLLYLRESKISFLKLVPYYHFYSNITMLIGDYAYKHGINLFLGKCRWYWEQKVKIG